jgi:FkbM family methyltransferase
MNWKLAIGKFLGRVDNALLRSKSSFIKNNYPYRRSWIYDVKRLFPNPAVIADVGAYIGDVTLELHQHFPNAVIYSFEPIDSSFGQLKGAVAGITNIHINKLAAGESKGTIEIPLYAEASINTLKQAAYDSGPINSQKIDVERLDDFFDKKGISSIDIIKIDVEGYEIQALTGAAKLLKNAKYIVTEVGFKRCETKTYFVDMDIFMEKNGFEIFNIYELLPAYNDRTRLFYANCVYVNKNINNL